MFLLLIFENCAKLCTRLSPLAIMIIYIYICIYCFWFDISFYSRSHGDNSPFDGPGRVLAHAYFPSDGKIHFDEDENYSSGRGGIHLLWVAVHEIGHAIGLDHSNVRGTIMWPSYGGYNANIRLHQDDINGIRSLYGTY